MSCAAQSRVNLSGSHQLHSKLDLAYSADPSWSKNRPNAHRLGTASASLAEDSEVAATPRTANLTELLVCP